MRRFPSFKFSWRTWPYLLLCSLAMLPFSAQASKTILVLGDSLSAGYGIRQDAAWPALLATRLQDQKFDYKVINASISGETTSGGHTRLEAALNKHTPSIVIIALGSNDGLRGLPVVTISENLSAMSRSAQNKHAKVLIVGQRLPPNFGAYATQFQNVFATVAKTQKTAYVPFLLKDVATRPELFQADQLHPVAEAQPILLDNVWLGLEALLSKSP